MSQLSFVQRRMVGASATLAAFLLIAALDWIIDQRLGRASVMTGSTLLACLVGLVLIGVRRRLPILPLGTVATWTQVHLYSGFFVSGVYVLHAPALIGNGVFECGLSLVFWIVTLSGFYGLYASRTLPKRLTAIEGQHRMDRVNWHRNQISTAARELLEKVDEGSAARVLGTFYTKYLHPFFAARPSLAYVVAPHGLRRRRLLSGLRELDRYLEREGRDAAGKLAALVRRRDDLDYQFALQIRLRIWLVVHGFFSLTLLIGGVIHALIALRFMG